MIDWLIFAGILIVVLLVVTYIQDRQIADLKEDVELYFKEVQNEMAQKHETGQRFWGAQGKLEEQIKIYSALNIGHDKVRKQLDQQRKINLKITANQKRVIKPRPLK